MKSNKRPTLVQHPSNVRPTLSNTFFPGRQTPTIPTVYGRQSVTTHSQPVESRWSRSCLPTTDITALAAGKKYKPTSNIFFISNSFVITTGYDIPSGGVTPPLENPPREKKLAHKTIFSLVDPPKESNRGPKKSPSTGKTKGVDHE